MSAAVVGPLPPLEPEARLARPAGRRAPAVPFWNAPPGYCRWCGLDLGRRLKSGAPDPRARWHPACVEANRAAGQPAMRRAVWDRELGVCQSCGRFCPWNEVRRLDRDGQEISARWEPGSRYGRIRRFPAPTYRRPEADHIVPVEDGGAHELANLQLLCDLCHRAKTAGEATTRAARRRLAAPVPTP